MKAIKAKIKEKNLEDLFRKNQIKLGETIISSVLCVFGTINIVKFFS